MHLQRLELINLIISRKAEMFTAVMSNLRYADDAQMRAPDLHSSQPTLPKRPMPGTATNERDLLSP